MNFRSQSYPLYFAYREADGQVTTGRIIGWMVPDERDPGLLQPIVLFDEADASVSEPRYLNLETERYWIDANKEAIRTMAQNEARNR